MGGESNRIVLVGLKSFGDFVISQSVVKSLQSESRDKISNLIGPHLASLNESLGSDIRTYVLSSCEDGVPAIFDLKKKGYIAGLASAWRIRNAVASRSLHQSTLLFDRIGRRERFIAGRYSMAQLPQTGNIYLGYERFFDAVRAPYTRCSQSGASAQIVIFPSSRLGSKRIPDETLAHLLMHLMQQGATVKVFVLDGEPIPQNVGVEVDILPRNFRTLINVIKTARVIVSADSVPAHIAEFLGRPVYVLSRGENRYWLPLSCYIEDRWDTFVGITQSDKLVRSIFGDLGLHG